MSTNTLIFSSGRSVKRLKQDAKALAKQSGVPLHQALDEIAQLNGAGNNWSQAISALNHQPHSNLNQPKPKPQSQLADELGITDDDLEQLTWETQTNESNDGLIYDFILTFDDSNQPEILEKIEGLSDEYTIRVSANAFDEPPNPFEDMVEPFPAKTDMNPYRKLMVLGLNELLSRKLLSLEWDGKSNEDTAHIEATIAGHNAIIAWSGIGFGEVRISVWWKYDHSKHPQANLTGNSRESFSCSSPLAKRQHYPKFVGVVCSAWLERQEGKYLQGEGSHSLIEKYTRKGELEYLKQLPNPAPLGYESEGRFHM